MRRTKVLIVIAVILVLSILYTISFFMCYPRITVIERNKFGTVYQMKEVKTRECYVPNDNNDKRARWLAACIRNPKYFNLNGYNTFK